MASASHCTAVFSPSAPVVRLLTSSRTRRANNGVDGAKPSNQIVMPSRPNLQRRRRISPQALVMCSSVVVGESSSAPSELEAEQSGTSSSSGGGGDGLVYGKFSLQGVREEMEDQMAIVDQAFGGYLYAGIFDGHNGKAAAQYLRDHLYQVCVDTFAGKEGVLSDEESAASAITEAFQAADSSLRERLLQDESPEKMSGSTAAAVFASRERVVVGNVGDCRTVVCRDGNAIQMSDEHRLDGRARLAIPEAQRITAAGGWVTNARVCGMLAVTRAFGDVEYKDLRQSLLERGVKEEMWSEDFASRINMKGDWLSVVPDVRVLDVTPEDEFVIVACDGVWDVFGNNQAVRFVRKELARHGSVQAAAEAMCTAAVERRKSKDNVSVVIIDLGNGERGTEDPAKPSGFFAGLFS
eukprot:jgi/Chlat1/7454/Chrsp6S07463